MTLSEFLLARISEDEQVAQAAGGGWYVAEVDDLSVPRDARGERPKVLAIDSPDRLVSYEVCTREQAAFIEANDPARVLAECEAKRRIVEDPLVHDFVTGRSISTAGHRLLCHLVTIYADHPDYREEWRA